MRALAIALALALLVGPASRPLIRRGDPGVSWERGRLLEGGRPFTGTLQTVLPSVAVTRFTSYVRGVLEGNEVEIYAGGAMAARRAFSAGRKTGVHESWYRSGARRSYAEYAAGRPIGDAWEWYESGPPYSFVRFREGVVMGKKVWRENGQIFSNHVRAGTRFVGLPGAGLCTQLRGGGR